MATARPGAANVARIEVYIGASGSGKGLSIRRRLAELRPARLLVYDPRDEWAELAPALTPHQLAQLFLRPGQAPARGRFVPGASMARGQLGEAFAILCRVAFEAGSLVFFADELAEVTSPSWAPPAWSRCITQGRHRGLHLIAAAQRPALIDKTILSNATLLRVGAVGHDGDVRAMAGYLRAPVQLVAGLQAIKPATGGARMDLLERDRNAGTLSAVRLVVDRRGKATETRVPFDPPPLRGPACHVDR